MSRHVTSCNCTTAASQQRVIAVTRTAGAALASPYRSRNHSVGGTGRQVCSPLAVVVVVVVAVAASHHSCVLALHIHLSLTKSFLSSLQHRPHVTVDTAVSSSAVALGAPHFIPIVTKSPAIIIIIIIINNVVISSSILYSKFEVECRIEIQFCV